MADQVKVDKDASASAEGQMHSSLFDLESFAHGAFDKEYIIAPRRVNLFDRRRLLDW